MKHNLSMSGYGYRLRPVKMEDAQFIIDVRLEDKQRNRYIHEVSPDVSKQEQWIAEYFVREGDYYFVIENLFTRLPEGLISFYNVIEEKAEWGRWVIRKGSLAAAESVDLMYRIAFEKAGLEELYCRTIEDNKAVISFHSTIGEKNRGVLINHFELDGKLYNVVEQFADKNHYFKVIHPLLEEKADLIARRNIQNIIGGFKFHHIGIATNDIEKDYLAYSLIGYTKEGEAFEDVQQGIRGLFLNAKNHPRIELLENLEGHTTLDKFIESSAKMYHSAYYVADIEKTIEVLMNARAKVASPLKKSVYFGKRICFLVLPNMIMIELMEN